MYLISSLSFSLSLSLYDYLATGIAWISFVTTFLICCRVYPQEHTEKKLSSGERRISANEMKHIFSTSKKNLLVALPVGLGMRIFLPVLIDIPWYLRFLVGIVVFDALYYCIHYLFHNVAILKRHHDMHHEYNLANPRSTYYSSMVENVLLNTATVCFVPFGLGFSNVEVILWFTLVSVFVSMLHSNMPIMGQDYHLIHHYKRYCNYGLFGITDIMMMTFCNKFSFSKEVANIVANYNEITSNMDLELFIRNNLAKIRSISVYTE